MNDIEWIIELQERRKKWEKNKKDFINLDLFDKWLNQEFYVRPKYKRTEIITLYKKILRENKTVEQLEEQLDKIGWDEITYNNITNYIVNYNYRVKENKKLEV